MTRLAVVVLLASLGCGSGTPPPAQEPTPFNQAPASGDDSAAGLAGPQTNEPPPAGDQPGVGGSDRDGDGSRDDLDRCPDEPEDRDNFEDEDGCPEPDNDRDGIRDIDDKCPAEPESRNGRQDEDGCPD